MKKRLLCLLLAVSMLFGMLPAALAQDTAAYQPGRITKDLFIDAFERGDMVLLDLQYGLTLGENAEAYLGEDAALLAAVAEALPYTYLSVGTSKLEDGLRLMLGAEYRPDETQSAYASVILDLTRAGISVMSTAIEGSRLTIQWETILSLAGLSDSEISMILSLRDTDLQALIAELAAQIEPLMAMAAQFAAPYGETIAAHIAALPTEIAEDVPADENFPAAAQEIYVQITVDDVANLIVALADQLEQDTTLCALLDVALSEAGITAAGLCAAARETAADMQGDPAPLHLYVGLDEAGTPLYVQAFEVYDDDSSIVLTLTRDQGETEGSTYVGLNFVTQTADGEFEDGLIMGCEFIADPLDKNVLNLGAGFDFILEGEPLVTLGFSTNTEAVTTEDGLSGYAAVHTMDMTAADGETEVAMSMQFDSVQCLTADGGEQSAVSGTMAMVTNGQQIPVSIESYMLTAPAEEGTPSIMTEIVQIPALGIDEYMESMMLYTASYDHDLTEGKTVIAFETATSEELEELALYAMTSLSEMGSSLLEMLPPTLAQMISDALAAPVQTAETTAL